MPLTLSIRTETWPIAGAFTISRGAKTEAVVIVAEVSDGCACGRGECVPYARYGETPESVTAELEALRPRLQTLDRTGLQALLPAGAARNALDCALWDMEAKRTGKSVFELAGFPPPAPCTTAYTISLGDADAMAAAAAAAQDRSLLKIKLGGGDDTGRLAAVRRSAPRSELIVDANEGWTPDNLAAHFAACAQAGVTCIEQPLPAGNDEALATFARPVPVCADESVHDRATLPALIGKYDAVNVKLDKAGGLTEAIALAAEAKRLGLSVMVGCMVATSLAMAPALLLAASARWVDLDGPLLLARDRPDGLIYESSTVHPPSPALWG